MRWLAMKIDLIKNAYLFAKHINASCPDEYRDGQWRTISFNVKFSKRGKKQ